MMHLSAWLAKGKWAWLTIPRWPVWSRVQYPMRASLNNFATHWSCQTIMCMTACACWSQMFLADWHWLAFCSHDCILLIVGVENEWHKKIMCLPIVRNGWWVLLFSNYHGNRADKCRGPLGSWKWNKSLWKKLKKKKKRERNKIS